MKKIIRANRLVSIFFLGFIWSGLTNAQEASSEKPQSQEQSKRQPTTSKPKEKVFKPSEEISEDLPVPFPVDI